MTAFDCSNALTSGPVPTTSRSGLLDPALPKIRPNSVMNTIGKSSEKNSAVRSRTIIFMLAIVIA